MRSILSIQPVEDELATAKHCDLCGRGQFEVLSQFDRRRQPLVTEVCQSCGLVAHQQIPTEAELAKFYATEYRREYHGEITPSPRRVMRAWRNGQRILRQVAPFLTPRSRVLEVGAGIGCTVKAFEQQGHAATGIEPNDGFQAYSREQLRADVSKAYLFDLPPKPVNDLVLLVHVIEHFRSPRTALEHLHKLIRPDGLLYVECPNLGAIATRAKTFHFAHIHNFTPGTLATMARRTGFEVEHWFSRAHSPILQVLLRRMERPNLTIPADGFQQTMAAYQRYSLVSYYLRPNYLAARLIEVLDKSWERLAAPSYVRRILAECAQSRQAAVPTRKAA
jgi:2-polyprenyl-3-methyl-5-hydroxy-6-metoxy-1,4-benzoquinol methylase